MSRSSPRASAPTLLLVRPPQTLLLGGFPSALVDLGNFVVGQIPNSLVKLVDFSCKSVADLPEAVRLSLREVLGRAVVGITTTTATYQSSLAVARAFKAESPDVPVILGGHHSNTEDEIILQRHPEVDFVIRGEGEHALASFLSSYPAIERVPGLSYRLGSTIARNPLGPSLSKDELDQLGLDFEELHIQPPLGRCGRVTYVTARGCSHACSFCAVASNGTRAKSIQRVVEDLTLLVGKHGFRRIGIEDNFFAQSRTRTLALCRAMVDLRRSSPEHYFEWDCQTRVESMTNPELVQAMAIAGCEGVFLGVENFDPEILRHFSKTEDPELYVGLLMERVLPLIFETRMTAFLNLQMGAPIEGQTHIERNLAFLRRVGSLARQSGSRVVVCPMLSVTYPGTRLFSSKVASRTFPREVFETFTRWEAEAGAVRRWLGRRFAHGAGGIPDGILESGALARGQFKADGDRLLQIENYFDEILSVEGLEVFKYEPYLLRK